MQDRITQLRNKDTHIRKSYINETQQDLLRSARPVYFDQLGIARYSLGVHPTARLNIRLRCCGY